MSSDLTQFELPRHIDRYLAALSQFYAQDGRTLPQEIIVNSRPRVQAGWTHDNWDGGVDGHALFLTLPESLYLRCARDKIDLQNQIRNDLNTVHHVRNEFIDEVFFEMDMADDSDWREASGLILPAKREVVPEAQSRIWGDQKFHLFISHKAAHKQRASQLKSYMSNYGVSCFVAHEDIEPTREWQNEIEKALFSMDALLAMLTEEFFSSIWTNQEIGVAIGRASPILALRQGCDPRGFIGKFQAISRDTREAPSTTAAALFDLLWNQAGLEQKLIEALVVRLETASSYHHAINASKQLKTRVTTPGQCTPDQITRIEAAASEQHYVKNAYFVPERLMSVAKTLGGEKL